MAKKGRSSRKSSAAKRRGAAKGAASSVARPRPTGVRRSSRTLSSPKSVDFSTEYHYVLGDLKRIAILAVAMLATLVVLALIVR